MALNPGSSIHCIKVKVYTILSHNAGGTIMMVIGVIEGEGVHIINGGRK